MTTKITCENCGSTIELTAKTIPPKNSPSDQFPHIKALLYDAKKIHMSWNFDEQQADPIHTGYTFSGLKAELRKLLEPSKIE